MVVKVIASRLSRHPDSANVTKSLLKREYNFANLTETCMMVVRRCCGPFEARELVNRVEKA